MYLSPQYLSSPRPSTPPVVDDGTRHFGLKLYKDSQLYGVEVNDTRGMWNILVFMSGAYTPDMGYKETGLYIAPVLDFEDGIGLGGEFKGFLLSVPFSSWRIFDTYNLERQFMSFHFNPYIELDPREIRSIGQMMELLEDAMGSDSMAYNDMELVYLCRAITATINRHVSGQEELEQQSTTGNRFVDRFLQLVEKNCLKEKKLDFYAEQLGITAKYLSSAVTKHTGKKANRWISDYVIIEANKLLASTSAPIGTIAKRTGFITSSDFCRFYRTHTGISPMQYRKGQIKQGLTQNIVASRSEA